MSIDVAVDRRRRGIVGVVVGRRGRGAGRSLDDRVGGRLGRDRHPGCGLVAQEEPEQDGDEGRDARQLPAARRVPAGRRA